MSDFIRFAIYYLPPEGSDLARFGASWLGWDVDSGAAVPQPDMPFDIEAATRTPRKYGFHGTIKPPFKLPKGKTAAGLQEALEQFCAVQPAVTVDSLAPRTIGRFLALTPQGNLSALNSLAGGCVAALDDFRAPLDAEDLARRRAGGLTQQQEVLLARWGYPFVMAEFRFHMTLTGRLAPEAQAVVKEAVAAGLPVLQKPYVIDALALVGEGLDGTFRTIHRSALSG